MVKPPDWRRKICAKTMWNVSIIQNYKKNRVCDNIRKTQEKGLACNHVSRHTSTFDFKIWFFNGFPSRHKYSRSVGCPLLYMPKCKVAAFIFGSRA